MATGLSFFLCLAALSAWAAQGVEGANPITAVRLAKYSTPRQGLLQVKAGGKWYDGFCQTGDGDRDYEADNAAVICRQLGYGGGSWLPMSVNASTLPSILNAGLRCTGKEAALAQCEYEPSQDYDCVNLDPENDRPQHLITVLCSGAAKVTGMRLRGGSRPSEGRVEVQVNGRPRWGALSVCTSNVDPMWVARKVCGQLGFSGTPIARGSGFYGNGSQPPAMALIWCSGKEARLDQCETAVDNQGYWSCDNSFGVACRDSVFPHAVRLRGGPSRREGRLEVQLKPGGRWGGVCEGSYFPFYGVGEGSTVELRNVARAACRQLGYSGGALHDAAVYTPPGDSALQPSIANARCSARAASLAACTFSAFKEGSCDGSCFFQLGVACSGSLALSAIRLQGGLTPREGRLEVLLPDGRWGSVCQELHPSGAYNEDFAYPLARTACAQLGFGGGAPRGANFHGKGPAASVGYMACPAGAARLAACFFSNSEYGFPLACPDHGFGVACAGAETFAAVRLANGTNRYEGRLEVKLHKRGTWHIVRDLFGNGFVDAPWDRANQLPRLACKALGFRGGAARYGRYGRGTAPNLLANCMFGNETALVQCQWEKGPQPWGSDFPIVGVQCQKP